MINQGPPISSDPSSVFSDAFLGVINYKVLLDKKIIITLKDGRKFQGFFKVFDQFGNVVITDALERIFIENQYGEKYHGILLIRGENIVLVGEYDEYVQKNEIEYISFDKIPITEILAKQHELIKEKKRIDSAKRALNKELGLLEADIMAEFDL